MYMKKPRASSSVSGPIHSVICSEDNEVLESFIYLGNLGCDQNFLVSITFIASKLETMSWSSVSADVLTKNVTAADNFPLFPFPSIKLRSSLTSEAAISPDEEIALHSGTLELIDSFTTGPREAVNSGNNNDTKKSLSHQLTPVMERKVD